MVYRVYVEKKKLFAVEGGDVLADLNTALGVQSVKNVRIVNRYDVEGISEENFKKALPTVFSEPPVDDVYFALPEAKENERIFAVEFLPGQFDQRADSAAVYSDALQGRPPRREIRENLHFVGRNLGREICEN